MTAGWSVKARGVRAVAVMLVAMGGCAPAAAQAPLDGTEVAVVWLVRHAERADDGAEAQADPELSRIGQERAIALARLLGDAEITAIYSTPFQRTRQTAAPLAAALGLAVDEYDPRDDDAMARFLERIRSPGRYLVVGHSNTTPSLVTQLGGDAVSPIDEMEYDRIYVVTIGPDGSVSSSLLRFGAPSPGG